MIKNLTSLCLVIFIMLTASNAFAGVKKKKKKSHLHKTSRHYKVSKRKHTKKSRHHISHAGGPDIKEMTSVSQYTESPNNGVRPIESAK